MEPIRLPPTCNATRKDGQPCRFAARRESGLCVNHDPAFRLQQQRNRERGLRNAIAARQAMPIRLDQFDLADRAAVQSLVDAVIRLELTGRLSDARGRRLIRLLSIAIRNFDPPPRDIRGNPHIAHHDRERYDTLRAFLEPRLEQICTLADERDAARAEDN